MNNPIVQPVAGITIRTKRSKSSPCAGLSGTGNGFIRNISRLLFSDSIIITHNLAIGGCESRNITLASYCQPWERIYRLMSVCYHIYTTFRSSLVTPPTYLHVPTWRLERASTRNPHSSPWAPPELQSVATLELADTEPRPRHVLCSCCGAVVF